MCGLILITVLPDSASLHDLVTGYDSNRWAHFISYAAVATIPFAAWKRKTGILFSLLLVFLIMALEFLPIHVQGEMPHSQSIPADLFGIAAGVLLGLNLRLLRNSARSLNRSGSPPALRH